MRDAIHKEDHARMLSIIDDPRYDPNIVGCNNQRTALHTAAQFDNSEAIGILLSQVKVNPNVQTSTNKMTPLMLAASKGRSIP